MTSQHWSKRPRLEGGWGACQPGPLAERIGNVELNPLRSALLCRPYVGPNASLVAQDPSGTCSLAPKICSLKPMAPTAQSQQAFILTGRGPDGVSNRF